MEIKYTDSDMDFQKPYLVEGLPGVGLVAKIAADHIVEQLDMDLYAEVYSDATSSVTVFEKGGELRSAVRVYGSREHDLLVLKSDAPISGDASDLMEELNDWMLEDDITPIYQLGVPLNQKPDDPRVNAVYSGGAERIIEQSGLEKPPGFGIISGPTGGLLEKALEKEMDAIGLTVESDPRFPDPLAAKKMIDEGVQQILGFDIDTSKLKESAEEIKEKKKQLAQQIQQAEDHEKSQAYPSEMYV